MATSTNQITGWPDLYARLASQDWQEMTPGERMLLEESVAALPPPGQDVDAKQPAFRPTFAIDGTCPRPEAVAAELPWLAKTAGTMLRDLVDGKERQGLTYTPKLAEPTIWVSHGELHREHQAKTVKDWLMAEFLVTIEQSPFPFGRCPHCRDVFFIRRKGQKYCSPACTSRSNEERRRGKRTAYYREQKSQRRANMKTKDATHRPGDRKFR